jgi:restriction endonuclease S subunit
MWALNSSKARSQVEARQSGSTRKRISRKNLATITLPIAPRPEQDRIVAAIEEHISRLESAEGLLGSAGQRSVSLRAAVIDAIAGTDAEAVLLGEIVDVLDSQRVPVNAKEREARQGDVPYYGATGPVGWIDTPLFNEELVLLGEDGAPFLNRKKPKAYMIRGPAWVNNHAHVLRARSMTSNRFLLHALNSVDYTSYVNGTTRLKLTQVAMREIRLPLPPRSEQDAIVASLEAQLSALNAVATTIDYSLVRSEQLRRSILERAFTGQLVAQDPNDEPASALLARIAAERPATTKPKRKTRA